MSTIFRRLFDLVQAAGGQPAANGTLPAGLGTGKMQLLDPEPGLTLVLYHCTLARELTRPDSPPALLTAAHPVVLDTLLTPEIQLVLAQLAEPRAAPYQHSFFYKIKTQEPAPQWH
ncbi:MAG: hypothetical protein EOO36_20585 [Cytophagaceae bacterium]|nr:MAG: hypothetical protein EOO36_20585 [Cytophagaceae bacterium]